MDACLQGGQCSEFEIRGIMLCVSLQYALQLLFYMSLVVGSIDCGKGKGGKKASVPRAPGKFASVTKSTKSGSGKSISVLQMTNECYSFHV
ncbi:hypothetical protein Y032_0023g791 [Ancylostoma ceylanicum]|uniref:Uncharacterized protein n=1 Tax=Ancylostoma ceylanicum TaxID=53326 RepID=A0A016UYS5_9BILA|nr:hypothetical protein Y032_0023g791 [Ancylostoma ceylanicum]